MNSGLAVISSNDPKLRQTLHHNREQLQRGRVDPMGILEHHQHRLARREALELPPKRRQRCLLALLRAQFRQGVALARRQRQKVGQNRDRMHRINAGLHEQGFELGKLFGGRVAALEAGGSFELTDERKQRTVGVMRRAVVAQPDMWFGLQPLLKRKRNVRLADARLSGQHHDTTFALRGIAPAAREHLDFVVAPEQRRQSGGVLRFKAACHFARAHDLPSRRRFGPAFERDWAEIAVFEESPGDSAGTRGDHHCTRLGGRLQARREVRRFADDRLFLSGAFADQIAHHHRAGRDANAHFQRGLGIGPQISYSVDQREPGAHALRGVILVRLGIAEIDENAIAHVAGDDALIATDDLRDASVISTDHSAQVLRIEAGRKRRRAHQVANHHSEMTALGSVFEGPIDCRKSVGKRYFRVCISAEGSDGVKKLSAMSDNTDAQILQVVCRQTRQDRLVDLIFAECRLIPFEAKAPQPTPDVHHRALALASA